MAILDALGNAFQGMGCRSRQVDKSEDKYEDELDGDSYIFLGGITNRFKETCQIISARKEILDGKLNRTLILFQVKNQVIQ